MSGATVTHSSMPETVELEDLTELSLRLTYRMLAELERRMDGDGGLAGKTAAQYKGLGTDLTKNVRALTGMLREARAQKKDAYALFRKMSAAERNEAVLEHCKKNLSPEQQRSLIQTLLAELNQGAT